MVRLTRIYTRAGDRGSTRLASGAKASKASPRVAAYGEVDELNAVIGLARLETGVEPMIDDLLARIQNDLFDLGADLATPAGLPAPPEPLRIVASQVARLEQEIDEINARLEPLESFILPGGCRLAAHLHHARTVCRRAERAVVAFLLEDRAGDDHAEALRYLNRLSDLLFVAARAANGWGRSEVLWAPGAGRG